MIFHSATQLTDTENTSTARYKRGVQKLTSGQMWAFISTCDMTQSLTRVPALHMRAQGVNCVQVHRDTDEHSCRALDLVGSVLLAAKYRNIL